MAYLLNSVLFPRVECTYEAESLPGLIWVPEAFSRAKVHSESECESFFLRELESNGEFIPCSVAYAEQPSKIFVLYFHANSCDLGEISEELQFMAQVGRHHVVAFEYPGYGICKTRSCSPQKLDAFASAVFDFLYVLTQSPRNIVLMGRSIGTGPCARLAATLAEAGVVVGGVFLHSPFKSIRSLIDDYVPYVSAYAVSDFWNTQAALQKLRHVPLAVQHAERDEIIPVSHAHALLRKRRAKRTVFSSSRTSSHNDYDVCADICEPLQRLLALVDGSTLHFVPRIEQAVPLAAHVHAHTSQLRSRGNFLSNLIFCNCMNVVD